MFMGDTGGHRLQRLRGVGSYDKTMIKVRVQVQINGEVLSTKYWYPALWEFKISSATSHGFYRAT